MSLPFALPPIGGVIPRWESNIGFRVGSELVRVIQYSANEQGWNDELTVFHEESAGDQHFIDRASRDYALGQVRRHLAGRAGGSPRLSASQPRDDEGARDGEGDERPVILEVGCSSGFMLERMQKAFPQALIIGSDVVSEPLKKLAQRLPQIPLLRFDLTACPLPDNSIDALVMLNVLEHIEDDAKALQQAYRILKPGGALIIEVPAGPQLYDAYDKVLMHYRRYRLPALGQLIKQQGFQLRRQSHLGFFMYPGFWFVKQRNKRYLTESDARQRQQVEKVIRQTGSNKLLHVLMQTELGLGRFLSYPRGIRCLVTAIK